MTTARPTPEPTGAAKATLPAPPAARASRQRRIAAALWPVALFAVLTVVMTWPLVTNLSGTIISGITADADVSRWDLWWVKTALLQRHSDPFFTDMLYFPYRDASNPLPLYYHTLQPLNAILALPVLLLSDATTGPTLGYNLLVLVHFVLSGCAMFWLVRYLTRSTAGGLVAGVLFTFSPFHQYHLHEAQLELIPIEWLPLFVLFLHRLLYRAGGPWRNGLLAVACLVATSLTSWYWTLYLLLIAGLFGLVRLVQRPGAARATILQTAGVVVAWVVLIAPFLVATIRASLDPTFELVSGLDYEVRFSLSPLDLFTVSKDPRIEPAVWFMGTFGYAALALAVVGVVRMRRRAVFWLLLLGIGGVLALGPYLKWNDATDVAHTTGIPLPYQLVRNLPFLSIARVPRRFILLADLGLYVLAGVGAGYLVARARTWAAQARRVRPATAAMGVLAVLLAVPLLEFAVIPQPARAVTFSPFFSRLAAEPGVFPILELPITSHYLRDHARMLYQTVHGKQILGGYVARRVHDYYLDEASPFYRFIALAPEPKRDVTPAINPLGVLAYYHIPYVVVYKEDESYEKPGDRAEVEAYARRLFPDPAAVVQDDALLTAYRVPALPAGPLIWPGNGWQTPETQAGRTWRWSSGQDATLEVLSPTPLTWHLRFTSATLQSTGHLEVQVNGTTIRALTMAPGEHPFDLGTVQLPRGASEIRFVSDIPAISPIAAGTSTRDARKLGFLLADLQLPDGMPGR